MDYNEIIELIRNTRNERGMSVRKLEELSGIDKMAISKIERGMCPQVQLQTILKILDALDIDMTLTTMNILVKGRTTTPMKSVEKKKKGAGDIFNELAQGIHDGTIETIPLKSGKQSARLSLSPELNIKWDNGKGGIDINCVSRENAVKLCRKYKTIGKLEAADMKEIRSIVSGNQSYNYAVAHYILSLMDKQ